MEKQASHGVGISTDVLEIRVKRPASFGWSSASTCYQRFSEVPMAQFLIVEEDRRRFEQMKQCLLAKGHKAWQAATPAEAFDFLDQYSVDVIISAVHLEKGDVSEFLRQVKENDRLEQIPFIFCCTQEEECGQAASSETVQAGKVLGARKYILLQQFDAAKFWEQLEDCLPQNAQKNDSLGGQVKTYSIHDVSWSRQNR